MKAALLLALTNVRHTKKRSWLTIIGIFIGITAVVSLISLGEGLQEAITGEFEKIGSDKLIIRPAADLFGGAAGEIASPLTTRDVRAVEGTRGVAEATYYTLRSTQVDVGDERGFYFLAGIPVDDHYDLVREFLTVDLSEGRELRSGDGRVALVGADYARREVFLEPVRTGDRIAVAGEKFTVVGVLEPIGNAVDDRVVWVPRDVMEELLGIKDTADVILARTAPGTDPSLVAEDAERALLRSRGLREETRDFYVETPEDLLASFGIILTIVQAVLVGVALISLLVGGIGIMNTMYTAVLERTKEIGIMKAIGATPRIIQSIFLVESGLLGLVGGGIGVLAGLGIAKGVEIAGRAALNTPFLSAHISAPLILGALAFSMCTGMLAGYLPARAASRQDPIESLRYE